MLILAHGLSGIEDLPIPRWLFAWAAAVVLVASFVGLATLWRAPQLQDHRERTIARLPRLLEPLCGALSVVLFALVVYAGLAGEQTEPANNFAPTYIFVVLWVGVPIASVLIGDVFRAFNPWRAVARAAMRIAPSAWSPPPYPARLGRWPAVAGVLGFGWLELVYANRDDPRRLALFALAYALLQLAGMARYGVEPWLANGDALSVYFGLFARLSPLRWTRDELRLRRPLEGVVGLDTPPGTVALLAAMIGTTSFDGFSAGPIWKNAILPAAGTHTQLVGTVGLLGAMLFVLGMYRFGVAGMRTVGGGSDLAERFVHSLVPIALAYVIAHYFSLLIYQGQGALPLARHPLDAAVTIHYGLIGASGIWLVQVAALLAGHVSGIVLAHDRALAVYPTVRKAARSQHWMLAVMVGFTCLGLWLLSASA